MNFHRGGTVKSMTMAFTFEVTNLLNTNNTAIVNPVTGRAWEVGDPVPSEWRDPPISIRETREVMAVRLIILPGILSNGISGGRVEYRVLK